MWLFFARSLITLLIPKRPFFFPFFSFNVFFVFFRCWRGQPEWPAKLHRFCILQRVGPNFFTFSFLWYSLSRCVAHRKHTNNQFVSSPTRNLQYGDQIGFYNFDGGSSAITAIGTQYNCDGSKNPLLTISPSVLLNSSHPTVQVPSTSSPARSPYFGGLPQGRYKLCYCVRPKLTNNNPSRECRPADYTDSVGEYISYDVPGKVCFFYVLHDTPVHCCYYLFVCPSMSFDLVVDTYLQLSCILMTQYYLLTFTHHYCL